MNCRRVLLSATHGRCCRASIYARPSPRPFTSLPRPSYLPTLRLRQQQQQLRTPCSDGQHRPDTALVARAAGRLGSGSAPKRTAGRGGGRGGGSGGGGSGRSGSDGGVDARVLTTSITTCRTTDSLIQLVERRGVSFNFIHVSAALSQAAKLMQLPLTVKEEGCVTQLVEVAESRLADCGSQALANMAWALAKLDSNHPAFMKQLCLHSSKQMSRFKAQDTANTLWAVARLGCDDETFAQQLFTHSRTQLQEFNPQDIVNTLWAMAKLQHVATDRNLVQQLLSCARPQLEDFNHQDIANTAWALATLRHYDAKFMEQVLQQAKGKLSSFNSQEVSNMLWALATLNHDDITFVDGAVSRQLRSVGAVSRHGLCNTLWALSMLLHTTPSVVGPLLTAAAEAFSNLESSRGDPFLGHQLHQVHQYLVTMEGQGHISRQLQTSAQYQQLRTACRETFLREAERYRARPPRSKVAVLDMVNQLPGCNNAEAVRLTGDQDMAADVSVALPCGKVAVQVEICTAFMANAPDLPTGPVLWRRQQLAARGYKVVVVSEADWLDPDMGPALQRVYLQQRFRQAGVVLPVVGAAAGAA